MGEPVKNPSRKTDLAIVGLLAAVAAVLYFASMAGYAFPGESARLMAVWSGLDAAPFEAHPLMAFFFRLLGGNLLAPVSGVVAVVCLYALVSRFIRDRVGGECDERFAAPAGRVAGLVAAAVFMLAPAVRESASHLEPRLFSVAWLLASATLLFPLASAPRKIGWLIPGLIGVALGLGGVDSPVYLLVLPLFLLAVLRIRSAQGCRPWAAITATLAFAAVAYVVFALRATGDFQRFFEAASESLGSCWRVKGWLFLAAFALLPFLAALFSSRRSFANEGGWAEWVFHLTLSLVSVLAIATPLAPSAVMARLGLSPVLSCAYVAATAGYLAAYWWLISREAARRVDADEEGHSASGRPVACVTLSALAIVWTIALLLGLFSFERDRGAFADAAAERMIEDLGERPWLVTDGTLDHHLMLAAARKGRPVKLVCLARDLDEDYLAALADIVRESKVGGAKNEELQLSLTLGVLPFVQDWFAADPAVTSQVAVVGAPDLWYAAGHKAVPEFLFFGGDGAREPDWSEWVEFDRLLVAPKGWGSYRRGKPSDDPIERLRLNLRRHMGLVANDRGVWLQDAGREAEAFDMYERVLNEIDRDNVCALLNEFEMARSGFAAAVSRKNDIERRLKLIVDDADRRYRLVLLSNYYGYIRNPDVFVRLGFAWAGFGRPGAALSQVRRAVDLLPSDHRAGLLNVMAALYAGSSDRKRGRETYELVLRKEPSNHAALIGLMRLELEAGNAKGAIEFLERAVAVAGEGAEAQSERAMLAILKGDLDGAEATIRKLTDTDDANPQAWSLLSAVLLQRYDTETDAQKKVALLRKLEMEILPAMEKKFAANDYNLQMTRGLVLMRKGADHRKEARDALASAARLRPDIAVAQDLVLGLDISMDDPDHAEREARAQLRRNRKAPLANYVMGSLALRNGDFVAAERYLRRAVEAPRPSAMALNDLAEVLRRRQWLDEAEKFARRATETEPKLYVAWETLGSVLMDAGKGLDEAERCVEKACELSKQGGVEDVRMLISLARVQLAKGESARGRGTLRKVQPRVAELTPYEQKEYEDLRKSAR